MHGEGLWYDVRTADAGDDAAAIERAVDAGGAPIDEAKPVFWEARTY